MWAATEFEGKEVVLGGRNQPITFLRFRLDKRLSCYKWIIHVLILA